MNDDFVPINAKDEKGRDVFVFTGPGKQFDMEYFYQGDFVAFENDKPVKTHVWRMI